MSLNEAVSTRKSTGQQHGLIPDSGAHSVMYAIIRLNISTLIETFGQHSKMDPEPVRESLLRTRIPSRYREEWYAKEDSILDRVVADLRV